MILINETIIFMVLAGIALSMGSYILAGVFGVFWVLNALNDGE